MAYSNSWVVSVKAASIGVVTSPTLHDVLVAWAVNDSASAATFTWPSGFTQVANILTNTTDGQSLGVAIKPDATGSEGTLTIACNQDTIIGGVVAFSGRSNSTPQDVTAVTNTATDNATPYIVSQSITPVTNGCDILAIGGWDCASGGDGVFTFSATAGTTGAFTTRQDQRDLFRNTGIGTSAQVTAGALTIQCSVAGTGNSQVALVVMALRPAAVGSPYTLTADRGTFALTGQAANLLFGRKLAAAQASFTHTGQAANLLFGRKLAAAQGSFALTGQTAGLLFNRKLSAAQGAFALSGQAATLTYGTAGAYVLTAAFGSFALAGQAATLTYAPLVAYSLTAAPGLFTLTGKDAALQYSGGTPIETPFYGGGGNLIAKDRKSLRKDVEEDVHAAIAELNYVTKAAEKVVQAEPEPMRFEPAQARLTDAMRNALAVVDQSLSAIQRTQVQMALTAARETQRKLEAQEREARARIEMEAANRRAKRRKAAAIAAAYFFGDE